MTVKPVRFTGSGRAFFKWILGFLLHFAWLDQKYGDVPASDPAARFLDEEYPDSVLKARYPNMGILAEIGW